MTTPNDREHHEAQREALLQEAARIEAPTRSSMRLRNLFLMTSSIVVPLGIWIAHGGIRIAPRPLWFVIGTALGWAVAAVFALWASLSRQGSMLGPSRRWLTMVVTLVPAAMFAWMLVWDFMDTDRLEPWPGRWGRKCMELTLLMGAWPVAAIILMRRGSDPVHPAATGAAIGAAVGCATGVFLDLWCPIADPSHVLFGHIVPLMLLSLGGLLLGRWLLALRRKHLQ